jgi:hypothetical protein
MSIFADIDTALDTQLGALLPLPAIAWENKTYTPALGTLYLRPTSLPGEVVQASLGDNGQDQNVGVYQVDVFAKPNTGKKAAIVQADLVADHFKRGTLLTHNSRSVRIRSVRRKVGTNNSDGWFMITIEITYISFTQPRV